MCADIYMYIHLARSLGFERTEPKDAPNNLRFRLVDTYTSVTAKHHEDEIITCTPNLDN